MTAVSGAEIAATSIVLKKLFQAEPVKNSPRSPHSTPKPDAICDTVSVMSPRPMSLTKPPIRMTT